MSVSRQLVDSYASDIQKLLGEKTTREETYYPTIKDLISGTLQALNLPADVRQNTIQRRSTGGQDLPDLALYDGDGEFITVCLEVKRSNADVKELAHSMERNNQIGRYLAQTGVVIVTNLWRYALVTPTEGWSGEGAVSADHRRINNSVSLWSSGRALRAEDPPNQGVMLEFAELIEEAATHYAPIAQPETLARVLARQARHAKERLPNAFTEAVAPLAEDFAESLGITFEESEGIDFFRSSLIQTVYYGLFASWILWLREDGSGDFRWQELATHLKLPFLGELFHEIQHPSRLSELQLREPLDIATETLGRVDRERFFDQMEVPTLGSDDDPERSVASAIVYFYEPFLETLDPDLRKEMGVWYTPPSVVKYQVRRVEELLKEIGCERGFADENVVVLDPGCGTGAYLIEVISRMADTLRDEGVGDELAATLLQALQNRILGFEILTAPFVIAHLQLHLLLSSLGAPPDPDEGKRPGVYLTNALTGWQEDRQLDLNFPELQEERDASREVKSEAYIIVVLGNPPYERYTGVPIDEEETILDEYKGIERDEEGRKEGASELYSKWGIRKQVLRDLYIRFFRIAEERIGEKAEHGVVSLITNNSFLRGRSHPIMRESLLHNFDSIWIDNLNGDKYRTGKVVPSWAPGAGKSDESIFTTLQDPRGIQPGIAITTLLNSGSEQSESSDGESPATVRYRDFWGGAEKKRTALLEWIGERERPDEVDVEKRPQGPRPYEEFTPKEDRRWKLVPIDFSEGYEDWYSLSDLFPSSEQGVNPNRGVSGSVVAMSEETLKRRMKDYFNAGDEEFSFEGLKEKYPTLCKSRARYDPKETREQLLKKSGFSSTAVKPYVIFPLDQRYIYYETEEKLLNEHRPDLGCNLKKNEFLVGVPQARQESEVRPLLVRGLFDLHLHDRGSVGFPAETKPDPKKGTLFEDAVTEDEPRRANISPQFWKRVKSKWELAGDLTSETAKQFTRRLMRVCLAICHAPAYVDEHREALGETWAHVPLPRDYDLFREIARKGEKISVLLDPLVNANSVLDDVLGSERSDLAVLRHADGRAIQKEDLVVTISHFGSARGGWRAREAEPEGARDGVLWINDDIYFENVPEEVWTYELGGYPVVKKWLAYRDEKRADGDPLSLSQKDHLRSIIQRIAAVHELHPLLNRMYESALEDPWTSDA